MNQGSPSDGAFDVPVSAEEAARIEARCLRSDDGAGLSLIRWPKKQKEKLVLLRRIVGLFENGRRYSENEVNALLSRLWADHVMIRRYLIDYRLLNRRPDGSQYWRP